MAVEGLGVAYVFLIEIDVIQIDTSGRYDWIRCHLKLAHVFKL